MIRAINYLLNIEKTYTYDFFLNSCIKKSYEESKCSKNSTLKEPLLSEIDEKNDFILDRLPISNLHLTASIVNLIFEILVQKWGQNQGLAWLEKNHIQNEEYRYLYYK